MKTDCFAYGRGCAVLTECICNKTDAEGKEKVCRFYKTMKQYEEDKDKAMVRVRKLPRDFRYCIGQKYHLKNEELGL